MQCLIQSSPACQKYAGAFKNLYNPMITALTNGLHVRGLADIAAVT